MALFTSSSANMHRHVIQNGYYFASCRLDDFEENSCETEQNNFICTDGCLNGEKMTLNMVRKRLTVVFWYHNYH